MLESALSIAVAAHFAAGLGCIDFFDLDTTYFIKGEMAHSRILTRAADSICAVPGMALE